MRATWSDAECAEAAGVAHDAAWSTVAPRPETGWRNSYNEPDEPDMAAAHLAAHQAMDSYPLPLAPSAGRAGRAAWAALWHWDAAGRPLDGYEYYVPRPSEATERALRR